MGTTWLPPMASRCPGIEEARHVVLPETNGGGSRWRNLADSLVEATSWIQVLVVL